MLTVWQMICLLKLHNFQAQPSSKQKELVFGGILRKRKVATKLVLRLQQGLWVTDRDWSTKGIDRVKLREQN
jgi:hypothetical protein